MNLETTIMQRIRLRLSGIPGLSIFRNNVGKIEGRDGRWHVFGLCPGSSDLIGWKRIKITREMVGSTVAVFVAVEIKSPGGHRRPEQENFIRAVRVSGGIAGFAESEIEAVRLIP